MISIAVKLEKRLSAVKPRNKDLTADLRLFGSCIVKSSSFLLSSQRHREIYTAQNDLHQRRRWGCQSDLKQSYSRLSAHYPRNGESYAERADNSLKHYEGCYAAPVEVADKAEQERRQQTVERVCSEVIRGGGDRCRVFREDPRKQLAVEKGELCHYHAYRKRQHDPAQQGFPRAFGFSSSHILRDKRRHRLHKRRWDEHKKSAQLFGNADTG